MFYQQYPKYDRFAKHDCNVWCCLAGYSFYRVTLLRFVFHHFCVAWLCVAMLCYSDHASSFTLLYNIWFRALLRIVLQCVQFFGGLYHVPSRWLAMPCIVLPCHDYPCFTMLCVASSVVFYVPFVLLHLTV